MLVSPTMLEHARCTICQNFLSAPPIRVYFNREIKCARCFEGEDGGVISSLYTSVSKYLRYPCRNYLEGCKEILADFEVMKHENKCESSSNYSCPFCVTEDSDLNYTYGGYELSRHLKENHYSAVLNYPNFHMNTNYNQQCTYIYFQGGSLFFLHCSFDASLQEVTFDVKCLEENNKVTYNFTLHSTDDICQYSKKNYKCSTYEQIEFNETNSVKIIPKNYSDNKIFCKFEFIENGGLVLLYPVPICQNQSFKKTIKCTFEKFSCLGFNSMDVSWPYSLGENTWTVEIWKCREFQTLGIQFGPQDFRKSYKANVTVFLYSCQPEKQVKRTYIRDFLDHIPWGWSRFIALEEVLNPINGYIHSDTLRIKVKLQVDPLNSNETKATLESPVHVCENGNTTW